RVLEPGHGPRLRPAPRLWRSVAQMLPTGAAYWCCLLVVPAGVGGFPHALGAHPASFVRTLVDVLVPPRLAGGAVQLHPKLHRIDVVGHALGAARGAVAGTL